MAAWGTCPLRRRRWVLPRRLGVGRSIRLLTVPRVSASFVWRRRRRWDCFCFVLFCGFRWFLRSVAWLHGVRVGCGRDAGCFSVRRHDVCMCLYLFDTCHLRLLVPGVAPPMCVYKCPCGSLRGRTMGGWVMRCPRCCFCCVLYLICGLFGCYLAPALLPLLLLRCFGPSLFIAWVIFCCRYVLTDDCAPFFASFKCLVVCGYYYWSLFIDDSFFWLR